MYVSLPATFPEGLPRYIQLQLVLAPFPSQVCTEKRLTPVTTIGSPRLFQAEHVTGQVAETVDIERAFFETVTISSSSFGIRRALDSDRLTAESGSFACSLRVIGARGVREGWAVTEFRHRHIDRP